jgi:DNA polymerase-3 subunit alpha
MACAPDAYWAAKKNKVKYIPGCEIYFNDFHPELKRRQAAGTWSNAVKEVDPELYDNIRRNRHLTVLASNMVGYRNLIHMTTEAWEIGFYYKPRIWFEQLKKYSEGLIVLSGCLNGPVCHELRASARAVIDGNQKKELYHFKRATRYIEQFRDLLGDRFYLEVQMPGEEIPYGKEAFRLVSRLSDHYGIPAAVTNDCHYLTREDFKVQKAMMAVDQDTTIHDPNLFHVNSDEQFFKTRAQMRRTFYIGGYDKFVTPEKVEEFCDNTVRIAERCDGFKPDLSPKLPNIPDAASRLRTAAYEGLKNKGLLDSTKKYYVDGESVTHREQVEIELQRFIEKGFESYFLITQDLTSFSRKNGWDIGPARGSAGGSLVCYLLGIHDMDPLKWGLSFDRFLSSSRGGNMLKIQMED